MGFYTQKVKLNKLESMSSLHVNIQTGLDGA